MILHPTLQKRVREKCKQYFKDKCEVIDVEKEGSAIIDLK